MTTTASTLSITINTPRTVAQLGGFVKDPSLNASECRELKHLFQRLGAGLESASFTVQTSAAVTAAATGTITLTFASIANSDTVTVAGVTLTCVTGTPSGAQFKKVTDGPTTATNLAALINSNTTTNVLVSAAAAASVVTVTALDAGLTSNFIPLVTSNSGGFALSAATLAGGTGGANTVPVLYNKGR